MARTDYYVYGYFEPDASVPFYIGKGSGRRLYHHLYPGELKRKRGHFFTKLRKMVREGVRPRIEVVRGDLTETEAFEEERRLIVIHGRLDIGTGILLNHTDGGEGASGWVPSPEIRLLWSQRLKGRKLPPETVARMSGRESTPETLAKMSDSAKRRPPETEESRALRSQKLKGRKLSPETCAKMSDSRKGMKYSGSALANKRAAIMRREKPVESYDLATGVTVKCYSGINATVSDGYSAGNVGEVCRGKRKSHKGLGWRYTVSSPSSA